MDGYTPIKRLKLGLVLPQIGGPPWTVNIDGNRYVLRMGSQRLLLFKRSHVCACCGIRGRFFWIDVNKGSDTAQLNLYGFGGYKNRYVILMTMDHIIPRSKGGPTTVDNLQVLCTQCNNIKADKLMDIPELRQLVVKKAKARVKQKLQQDKPFIWKNNLELEAYETVIYGKPLKGGINSDKVLIPA